MSTKKLTPFVLILTALASSPLVANAENLLQPAGFDSTQPGSEIGEPWRIRTRGEHTAIVAKAPDGDASKDWAYIKDLDGVEKVYMQTDFSPISSGVLSFRLFFPNPDATVGIYLRNSELDKSACNIVEFKSLEGSGNIYVGANGNRQRLPVKISGPEYMQFDIEFSATDAGEKIDVYIIDTSGRHLIHSTTEPTAHPVDTVMITTDTKTELTEFYVGQLALNRS
ncbi:hypothetical protein [Cerasicoccus maritimus]|uniref:hypothetical protein n=1 Tax=Cerasicoccus maritimus TaxID=490089 RepID=UPI002852D6CE|nr:hypothetical protein [Cerasicoccus maritimus]